MRVQKRVTVKGTNSSAHLRPHTYNHTHKLNRTHSHQHTSTHPHTAHIVSLYVKVRQPFGVEVEEGREELKGNPLLLREGEEGTCACETEKKKRESKKNGNGRVSVCVR